MSRNSTPHVNQPWGTPGWGGGGGAGRSPYRSPAAREGFYRGAEGSWGGRRQHLYGPVPLWRGLYGRGTASRHRRDRPIRRRRSTTEAAREEHRDQERLRLQESKRISAEQAKRVNTLTVSHLDLHIEVNTRSHHTDAYACTTVEPKQLVLRRGQEFKLTLTFDRPYDKRQDDLFFIFSPDDDDDSDTPRPLSTAGHTSLNEIFQLDEKRIRPYSSNHHGWAARIVQSNGSTVAVQVHIAQNCLVGEWDLRIRTRLHGNDGRWGWKAGDGDDFDYDLPMSLIVLFNPWSPGDQVYFQENPEHLKEYILNESGLVFRQMQTPWFYGQFRDNMLAICLSLLRKAFDFRMTRDMADPVLVSRALSRIVNSQDDDGVLMGNWSGNYEGGTTPLDWDSSVKILNKFYNSGQPVKFAQCWVFSHVLTAVCRALGLPCRSVTNYKSAHDTDGNCTIDVIFQEDGDVLPAKKKDSIWNFHVWNEVWILRPDLQGDYDGWHVIDATPQETSKGLYQCGPCPVKAVKRGEVEVGYDTRFVFAEVNADIIHWTRKADGSFEVSDIKYDEVGIDVVTKHPMMECRLNIKDLYKYPEGSPDERAAVRRAVGKSRFGTLVYKDLHVWFEDAETAVGRNLALTLHVKNVSKEVKVVAISMVARATHYWNHVHGSKILAKGSNPQGSIAPGSTQSFSLTVTFQQYYQVCDDLWTIRGFAIVRDVRGKRVYTAAKIFSLIPPPLTVKGPEAARSGQSVKVNVSFTNPLPIELTGCFLRIDGNLQVAPDDPHAWLTQDDGTRRMEFRRDSAVRVSERVMLTVRLLGQWTTAVEGQAKKSMVLSFDCDQLGAMKGIYHLMRAP